ncbi:LysR family transcriptional regulator [Sulfitobacter donghicola]|uniref:LysR family transcriptional regulator n=1 Tax=Sulfitobacter donghicola DSW-25 = KCTC 12864 = JCM 14565 TaxID=1300350 RepID=A0A073IL54_9RHOB|nr:LysR family transcriptional regulator [Sulfitobacter donghicola]KEJ90241.1 LysR family transcriptional regulator [Sulfitobacter donghicola DSW-25 = KCTC 12864 = JCM 14565]KIN66591.1 Transcriptional regulator, LysR family protein [Sulfitobacter donghicola DSW-25 = KCTC 12864 = JCM 14565]
MKNWDDLRLFLAVAREESLSGAGKALRLDPATLGRRMARLEKDMQAALFVKSPQGYALTQAGEKLFERAGAVEQAMRSTAIEETAHSETLSGQIRLGAPDGCANFLLPQVCAAIGRENPALDIQIVALPRVFNLTRREADMAIGVSAPTAGRLVVRQVSEYRLHLAASEEYLNAHGPIPDLETLKSHPMVGYIPDMIFDRELDYLADLGAGRVALASNSVSVQLNMLRQSAGVGVVHDFSLPFAPGVRRILTEEVSLTRAFYLIRHVDDAKNQRLARFADLMAAGLKAEVARLEALSTEHERP